ncbi:hypothetical protein J6590_072237 [Homalodisca vitripennis]|nr:hypothetical protein J6590_072237 [Homalodisca vitripennis]
MARRKLKSNSFDSHPMKALGNTLGKLADLGKERNNSRPRAGDPLLLPPVEVEGKYVGNLGDLESLGHVDYRRESGVVTSGQLMTLGQPSLTFRNPRGMPLVASVSGFPSSGYTQCASS